MLDEEDKGKLNMCDIKYDTLTVELYLRRSLFILIDKGGRIWCWAIKSSLVSVLYLKLNIYFNFTFIIARETCKHICMEGEMVSSIHNFKE